MKVKNWTWVSLLLTVLTMSKEIYCTAAVYAPSGNGPIYVNPQDVNQPPIQVSPTQTDSSYVTQTVYGFLDFTTTIGNTIMVFSPQSVPIISSSAVVVTTAEKQITAESSTKVNTVIQTKPTTPKILASELNIEPSKTTVNNNQKPKAQPTSHVQNVPNSAQAPASSKKPKAVVTKVEVASAAQTKVNVISKPKPSTRVEVVTKVDPTQIFASSVDLLPEESLEVLGNNIQGEPEYDFLSRQPSEYIEETYQIRNIKPSKFLLKPRASSATPKLKPSSDALHPTGLVTKMGGTVVKDGATTVHETSVIGTFISGKYAQVLQSTSHIHHPKNSPKIQPTSSLRILKTAAPTFSKSPKLALDPTPVNSLRDETLNLPLEALFSSQSSNNLARPSRRPAVNGPTTKNRFNKGRSNLGHSENKEQEIDDIVDNDEYLASTYPSAPSSQKKSFKNRPAGSRNVNEHQITPTSVGRRSYQTQSRKFRNQSSVTANQDSNNGYTRRGYKPRIQTSAVEPISTSTSLYKFKLNRSPGRWAYKTTPKPRVTIRRQNDDDSDGPTPSSTLTNSVDYPNENQVTPQARSDDIDLESSGSSDGLLINDDENTTDNKIDHQPLPALETIKVEISTPADFKDIYYEIATIKSPYTFQVGSVKNTRFITVTSTIEKTFATEAPSKQNDEINPSEPLTENILAPTSHIDKEHNLLDSVTATLPAITLGSDIETPPLETLTETFSTTTEMLKTHILPVVRGLTDTSTYTLVQTYHVTRLVTATKTLPPMELYQFVPSKTLKDFNSKLDEAGSELHLELDFGDQNDQDDEHSPKRIKLPSDLDLAHIGSDFDVSEFSDSHLRLKKAHGLQTTTTSKPEVVTPGLTPEQLQQLALLRFLNPQAQIPQVVTTSKPVIKLETVYESHIIPIFNGVSTTFSTLSRPIATLSKTEYELQTTTLALPPLPTLPPNPLLPQQQFAITSTPVVTQTMVTATESKVLKLTFGAKTAYTTLFSTKVVPTILTTYVTTQIPVQPTLPAAAGFPGYFPPPYAPFPFVG